jgi:hypothetical protein
MILAACAPTTAKVVEPEVAEPEVAVVEESNGGDGSGGGGGDGSGGGKTNEESETAPATDVALKITGAVGSEKDWSEEEVKALPTLDVESTNSKDDLETYTGVLISELLALAVPNANVTTLVLVADDGFTAEVGIADVLTCGNCILSFRSNGGFSSVLPNFAKNLQVKGVIELQVK